MRFFSFIRYYPY